MNWFCVRKGETSTWYEYDKRPEKSATGKSAEPVSPIKMSGAETTSIALTNATEFFIGLNFRVK